MTDTPLAASVTCPDCGSPLEHRIEGFRPATDEELSRLTAASIRLMNLCTNDVCRDRFRVPAQRGSA